MESSSEQIWSHLSLDRVIAVVGATGGIGQAVARLAVQVGARTALIGRDQGGLDAIAGTLGSRVGELVSVVSDPRDFRSVTGAAEAVEQRFGHIDALVYCAGFGVVAEVTESPLADHEMMMDVNHFGAVRWTKSVVPRMLERQFGDIVLVASDGALRAFPGWSAYCASKHAMLGFAGALAEELSGTGVRVTTLCPGAVDSGFWDKPGVPERKDRSEMISARAIAEMVLWSLIAPRSMDTRMVELQPCVKATP